MLPIVFEIVLYNVLSKFCHTDMYGNELHDTQYDLQSFFYNFGNFQISRNMIAPHCDFSKMFCDSEAIVFSGDKGISCCLMPKNFWSADPSLITHSGPAFGTVWYLLYNIFTEISNKGSLWLLPPTTTGPVMTRIRRWSWWRRGGGEVVGSGDQVGEWRGGKLVADTNKWWNVSLNPSISTLPERVVLTGSSYYHSCPVGQVIHRDYPGRLLCDHTKDSGMRSLL